MHSPEKTTKTHKQCKFYTSGFKIHVSHLVLRRETPLYSQEFPEAEPSRQVLPAPSQFGLKMFEHFIKTEKPHRHSRERGNPDFENLTDDPSHRHSRERGNPENQTSILSASDKIKEVVGILASHKITQVGWNILTQVAQSKLGRTL